MSETNMLEEYLELAYAYNDRKNEIIKSIPKELTHDHFGKVEPVRELLLTEDIENTTLIQTEVYGTVLEGAEPSKVMRNALPVVQTKSNKLDWVYGEAGTYASEIAEGTEIPIDTQDYNKRTFTVKKYGTRPLITKELLEDGLFDVAALELRKAGARIENKLNYEALDVILENSGKEHDTGGSNQGVKGIAAAAGVLRANNYNPDTVIMHPDAEAITSKEFVPTAYTGSEQVMRTGQIGNVLGLRAYVASCTTSGTTYTWDYDTDGEIGMLVLDSKNAGAIAMRRDITVERYNDPIRDLVGMSVTARFATNYLIANAACRVEY